MGEQNRQPALTREQVRRVDRIAIEGYAIPGIVLMENAAIALRDAALGLLARRGSRGPVLILSGPGNNGGDGFALARHLHNDGIAVGLVLAGDRAKIAGDAATNLRVADRMRLPLETADPADPAACCERLVATLGPPALLVDALFGTGLDRPLRSPARELVGWINDQRRADGAAPLVLAVDIPSGLDSDTGAPACGDAEGVVRADLTVTLAAMKVGFENPASRAFTGEVTVGDIGAPREALARATGNGRRAMG